MRKKLTYLISFILVLGVVSKVSADLIVHWSLDESSGSIAHDTSGKGHNGTIGGSPNWVGGQICGALNFDGSTNYIDMDDRVVEGTWTLAMWLKPRDIPYSSGYYAVMHTDAWAAGAMHLHLRANTSLLNADFQSGPDVTSTTVLKADEWYHAAITVTDVGGNASQMYINGVLENTGSGGGSGNYLGPLNFGAWNNSSRYYHGVMDDIRIYNHVLTQEEVAQIMIGVPPGLASEPSPANEATDVPRDVTISWKPGEYAPPVNGHKIFFSENFTDVNDGIGGVTQDANSYAPPQRLDFGTTYYWRVDEVNGPPDYTVYKGDVWSFTTEPIGYPIENITATASSTNNPDMGPEKTINGAGLNADNLHSKEPANMWLSSTEPLGAWIQYEFDKVYKLHQMWVWNSNQMVEPLIGFGFKEVTIEYSTNGTDYTTLGTTVEFARAPGTDGYAHNTTIDFRGVTAKFVRLTPNNNWGGILNQYGLSEVRFFYIPVLAREPNPASGAIDINVDNVTLSWRAGREAAKHNVYFSDSNQAVIDGTAPVTTVSQVSYGPLSLNLGKTYYWRVDEVNEAEIPTTWASDLWSFTTRQFLIVDDFESYNDLDTTDPASNRIFNTWLDGYGTTTNGSIVGYENPPFAEKTIVHGDKQAMPFFYSNTAGKTYSEAERTFAVGQNWTQSGVKTLALFFYGVSGNTGQLYVKINGTKVTYDGDASNLALTGWQAWNIDLASVGVSLQRITKLAIGIDGNGAAGKLYFDDIRLYPYSRVLLTPVEPDPAGLVLRCEFEGNLNDSSGKGRNGTGVGNPIFEAGKVGQAVTLSGSNYVVITGYKGILGGNAFSIAAWVKSTSTGDVTMVNWGTQLGGQRVDFRLYQGRLRVEHGNGNLQGRTVLADGQWHHVAVTVKENASISYPDVKLYLDGLDDSQTTTDPDTFNIVANVDVNIGRRGTNNDRVFPGSLDDVRIYDRVLTQEEIAWLSGRTKPFDKPF